MIGIRRGDIEWHDENTASGKLSGVNFEYSSSGYGNDSVHKITIRYQGSRDSTITIIGEWELSEFESFVRGLRTRKS